MLCAFYCLDIIIVSLAKRRKTMLRDLGELADNASRDLKEKLNDGDIKLTIPFRDAFRKAINNQSGDVVEYSTYTAVVTRRKGGNLRVFVPNQQFYIASFLAPFAKELLKYKSLAMSVAEQVAVGIKDGSGQNNVDQLISSMRASKCSHVLIDDFSKYAKTYFCDVENEDEKQAENDANYLTKFVTDYEWWHGVKTIERTDFLISVIMDIGSLVQNAQSYTADIVKNIASDDGLAKAAEDMIAGVGDDVISENEIIDSGDTKEIERITGGFNQIVYGAPGTGKSYYIDTNFGSDSRYVRRVTFHSEYTYFDFVGTYKPVPVYKKSDEVFETIDGVKLALGEPHIDYQYVPGPFLDTYMEAWKDPSHMYTLIVEEINRANAAGVFGEIFQLLDRDIDGYSKYGVVPSSDLRNYMRSDLEMRKYADELRLPSNMNILATMNSADQGVEPMDAAFKRRWNFKYLPIQICTEIDQMSTLQYDRVKVYWERLITLINKHISNSLPNVDEDRLIGPYFISPREVGKKESVDKLLLYLWDDVFRNDRDKFFNEKVHNFSELSSRFEIDDVLNVMTTDEERKYLEADAEVPADGENASEEL